MQFHCMQGELLKVGISLARSTIRHILNRNGLPPTRCGPSTTAGRSWKRFWTTHAPYLLGIDIIQVPVGLFGRIINHHILFGIEHDTRQVRLFGITTNPTQEWATLAAHYQTFADDPLLRRRYWIHDNGPQFGAGFRSFLKNRGIKTVRTSVRAPDMNAFAERFVRSIRGECLDHTIFLNAAMLEHFVREYIQHYNTVRPHQGIGNKPISPWQIKTDGKLVVETSLHGTLLSANRVAA